MSWSVVWGLVSFACSQRSVCCPPSSYRQPCVPCGWSWTWPGFAASPPPFSPALPLTKHTVRVHPMCLWVNARSCHALSVCTLCVLCIHPAPPHPQPAPQRTRWVAPSSLLSHLPLSAVQLCALACFCVAGVSCDVAMFADMSPCPFCFSIGFQSSSLSSSEGTGLLEPGWGPRARPPSPVSPQRPISIGDQVENG